HAHLSSPSPTSPPEPSTLSLHDALPISVGVSNLTPCNWLQVMDNVMDLVHEAFLHARYSKHRFLDANEREVVETADLGELSFRRSEEHTSELQSRENLVCRLLLEKKK